jgi:hypothetical protein
MARAKLSHVLFLHPPPHSCQKSVIFSMGAGSGTHSAVFGMYKGKHKFEDYHLLNAPVDKSNTKCLI